MKNIESTVLKWSLTVGIIIVLNLFFNYAITLVYPEPNFDEIYSARTNEQCLEVGGEWIQHPKRVVQEFENPIDDGYCNAENVIKSIRDPYQTNVFVVLVVLGVLALVAGIMLAAHSVVATGLSYGGVLSLIIASMRYWSSASGLLRLIILGAALAALIYVAIKKFSE